MFDDIPEVVEREAAVIELCRALQCKRATLMYIHSGDEIKLKVHQGTLITYRDTLIEAA
jgi:hypothetical protein